MTDTTATVEDVETRVMEALTRLLDEHPPAATEHQEFWGAQFDAGLAWVDFPVGRGGLGATPEFQGIVNQAIRDAGGSIANRRNNILGIGMGAATIVTHGTEAHKDRYLRPLFTCEEIWCQLFSEPGAGSDLAGLATTAVKDGTDWIINGQKVWTTLGHLASFGLLVARHDADQVKHRGLTYFIVDMHAEGVEVRPLYQITGEAEFNEVFFNDTRVPDDHRVGDVGEGWRVAMTTLMNERVAIGGQTRPRGDGIIAIALAALDRTRDLDGVADPVARDEVLRLFGQCEALRLTTHRGAQAAKSGVPGPEGSTSKLQWADLNKEVSAFALETLGADGLLHPFGYELRVPEGDDAYVTPSSAFLRTRANSIEGGTSEIMRNILGERVLGLPGEPRVDKNIPWRDVPRS